MNLPNKKTSLQRSSLQQKLISKLISVALACLYAYKWPAGFILPVHQLAASSEIYELLLLYLVMSQIYPNSLWIFLLSSLIGRLCFQEERLRYVVSLSIDAILFHNYVFAMGAVAINIRLLAIGVGLLSHFYSRNKDKERSLNEYFSDKRAEEFTD